MRTISRLAAGVLVVTLALAGSATVAARRLAFNSTSFRMSLPLGYGELFGSIECVVTFEGSFHSRTLSKVSGQLVGYITRAAATRPCREGAAAEGWVLNGTETPPGGTAVQTLPWHLRFLSFSGTLPAITAIRIQVVGMSFLYRNTIFACLYRSTTGEPWFFILNRETATGRITSVRPGQSLSTTVARLTPTCAEAGWGGPGWGTFTLPLGGAVEVELVA
jgi:hypothetical protein